MSCDARLCCAPQVNPMAFMIATTISTSFAFMLPIGTPPNAIVFATKQLTIMDMLSASDLRSLPACPCKRAT